MFPFFGNTILAESIMLSARRISIVMSLVPRLAIQIEYFGKAFCGSQMQLGVRTVQAELEQSLGIFFRTRGERVPVTLAGRTDSGVHASGQVGHFDIDDRFVVAAGLSTELSPLDLNRMSWALNGILTSDLSVRAAAVADRNFHARHSAIRRGYVYRILNRPQRSALHQDDSCFLPGELDIGCMQRACRDILGRHDFTAFRSSNADPTGSVCRVERSELLSLGEGELEFWITADHFVYNMVRIIVGTLLEIGLGKRPETALSHALESKDRQQAGPTAPARGLCLKSVIYPAEFDYFAGASENSGRALRKSEPLSKSGDLES